MTVRRHASAHVFVHDLDDPVLDEVDHHHLVRVLRLRAGETVTVSDGRGAWRVCTMTDARDLEPDDDVVHRETTSSRPITVAFGVTKADKPETVVQKLTELGVDHIVPIVLDHSVVRWDETKIVRQHDRFTKVVREAAMQSRQVTLPVVHRVEPSLESFLVGACVAQQWGDVALAEPGGRSDIESVSTVIVGPEGGFSDKELALVGSRIELPGGILRAETAAIAAGVLLAHVRNKA